MGGALVSWTNTEGTEQRDRERFLMSRQQRTVVLVVLNERPGTAVEHSADQELVDTNEMPVGA